MDIYDFQWSEKIIVKLISKHNVSPEEVEQVFRNKHFVKKGKNVLYTLGRNDAGRYIAVIFIRTGTSRIRVISARDMIKAERNLYWRSK